jgi:sarcosine oxidase/L-pipecolate oxidase
MASAKCSYLIVGSGVFGVSTAYHLSKLHPNASIALLDRSDSYPCELAASHDFNKIVRADYGNEFYCKLALEARNSWVTDGIFKEYFHQTGMIVLGDVSPGTGQKIVDNYRNLNIYSEAAIIDVDEMKRRYNGLFEDADYDGVKEIFVNPLSGWAEATNAVKKVMDIAIENGVEYVKCNVDKLLFDDSGGCIGVQAQDGEHLLAEKVILSTGAGTTRLLANSAPDKPSIQAEDRITASAVITGVIQLKLEDEIAMYSKAPIFVHATDKVQGNRFQRKFVHSY